MSERYARGIISKLNKGGRLWIIVMGGLLGVALLLYGGGEREAEADGAEDRSVTYARSVEDAITELCSRVEGVREVSVAVSLENGYEYVYATEGDKTLTVGSGSSEAPVKVTEKPPRIGCVGIVCIGGGNPAIQKRLIELISAAYGISSNKIYITEAQK